VRDRPPTASPSVGSDVKSMVLITHGADGTSASSFGARVVLLVVLFAHIARVVANENQLIAFYLSVRVPTMRAPECCARVAR
jgi:hypothetical protein